MNGGCNQTTHDKITQAFINAANTGVLDLQDLNLSSQELFDLCNVINLHLQNSQYCNVLDNVKVLHISENHITDISFIPQLFPNLTHLSLSGNKISDIDPIMQLQSLHTLQIQRNEDLRITEANKNYFLNQNNLQEGMHVQADNHQVSIALTEQMMNGRVVYFPGDSQSGSDINGDEEGSTASQLENLSANLSVASNLSAEEEKKVAQDGSRVSPKPLSKPSNHHR